MTFTFVDIIVLSSLIQGVFVGCTIMLSPFLKSRANTYLGTSILVLALVTFLGRFNYSVPSFDYVRFIMWELLFPATFFHYFIYSLGHRFSKTKWTVWLFIPFAITIIVDTIFSLDFTFHYYKLPVKESSFAFQLYRDLEYNLSILYNIGLIGWSFYLVRKDSGNEPLKIKWLTKLCLFNILLIALWVSAEALEDIYGVDYFIFIWLGLSVLFWWICYLGIYNLKLLEQKNEIHSILIQRPNKTQQESKDSSIDNKYLKLLEIAMVKDELYKDPYLGRGKIAGILKISEGHLSNLINSIANTSIVDYINSFRIEAAKEMLLQETLDKYSLEALGMEAGFKSKSAFYTSFKKHTGKTPGEYREQMRKS